MSHAHVNLKVISLLIAGVLFSPTVSADEFSDALFSLQTEARAQANYFSGLIEEYRGMGDQNRVKIEGERETIPGSANAAQQSHMFWAVLEKSLKILSEQYSRISELTLKSKKNYESDSIQKALQFILEQVSRTAYIAFKDVAVTFKDLIKTRRERVVLDILRQPQLLNQPFEKLETFIVDKDEHELTSTFNHVYLKFREDPRSNPHLELDIDDMTKKYERLFQGFEGYRRYFIDFKASFSFYHYLYRFYVIKDPIESFPLIDLEKVKNRWVDQIAHFTFKFFPIVTDPQRFRKKKEELNFQREDGTYPLEGNFIAPKAAEDHWLREQEKVIQASFSERVDRDLEAQRKNMKNRKKKERKKRSKAVENQDQLVTSSTSPEMPSASDFPLSQSPSILPKQKEQSQFKKDLIEPNLGSLKDDTVYFQVESEVEQILSSRETSTVTIEVKLEEDDEYEINYQDYLSLIKNEKERTLEKIQKARSHTPTSSVEDSEPSEIILTGGAAKIYRTAMGLENFNVRNRDLQQFLNQVGGYVVKCSGRHSDPKIALPNFNENATNPFWVDKMHLMHSGAEHFPISRLRIHLYRMIIESGLNHFVKMEM